jgi:hypothetical protein
VLIAQVYRALHVEFSAFHADERITSPAQYQTWLLGRVCSNIDAARVLLNTDKDAGAVVAYEVVGLRFLIQILSATQIGHRLAGVPSGFLRPKWVMDRFRAVPGFELRQGGGG